MPPSTFDHAVAAVTVQCFVGDAASVLLDALTTVGAAVIAVAADKPVTGTALHTLGSPAEGRPDG